MIVRGTGTLGGRWAHRAPCCLSLVLAATTPLSAQREATADTGRVLLLEHRFDAANPTSVRVTLERNVAYRAELSGLGTLVVEPSGDAPRPAFLVPVRSAPDDGRRHYEVYPVRPGPHVVRVADLPTGGWAILRLYEDTVRSRRVAEKHDRGLATGIRLGVGAHTGYRMDPDNALDPVIGTDLEGCLLFEAGSRFGACFGAARQSLPDAGFAVSWLFIEPRVRVATLALGDRRTDVAVSARFSQGLDAGPRRSFDPDELSLGLHVTHHLAGHARRRGLSIFGALQIGRVGNVPAGNGHTARVTTGIAWLP